MSFEGDGSFNIRLDELMTGYDREMARWLLVVAALSASTCLLSTDLDTLTSGGANGGIGGSAGTQNVAATGGATGGAGGMGGACDVYVGGSGVGGVGGTEYRDAVLASTPAGYWRLDEPCGPDAFDQSGNGRHGTYTQGVTRGVPGALAGDSNAAIELDGVLGHIVVSDTLDFAGTESFTIEAWVRPVTTEPRYVLTKLDDRDGMLAGYDLYVREGAIQLERWGEQQSYAQSRTTLPSERYSHLVGTYDGFEMVLYVDGIEVHKAVAPPMALNEHAQPLVIGGANFAGYDFAGSIDEVAVYARALPGSEVTAHHLAGTR